MVALFEEQALFTSGEGGYIRYRIPALVIGQQGTILAFCEGRKETGLDSDQIDLLLRRSVDGGRTFDAPRVVAHHEGYVCGNPAPVLDRITGVIWLPFTKNRIEDHESMILTGQGKPRTVWVTSSDNDGLTWSEPVEITPSVMRPDWGWYATGPGHAIQLQSGRILVPCNHSLISWEGDVSAPYFAHILYSDDHGATWILGGSTVEGTNESMAVELADGRVYLTCRNAVASLLERSGGRLPEGEPHYRGYAISRDGGETFGLVKHDPGLPEPVCQASICRLTTSERHDRNRVLFANPPSLKRENLTVRLSVDECRTWAASRTLCAGQSAYSDLCVAGDLTIFCLYERGVEDAYETLMLAHFNLEWITEPQDEK